MFYLLAGTIATIFLFKSLKRGSKFGLIVSSLVVLVSAGIMYFERQSFPVHKNGAIVITGTSTGIGHDVAIALDKMGYTVYAGVRKQSDIQALQSEAGVSSRFTPIILDVTKQEDIDKVLLRVEQDGYPLIGIVNNAAIAGSTHLELLPLSMYYNVHDVNVLGCIRMIKTFAPLLRKSKGRVVNIGSITGRFAHSFLGNYHSSKWSLEALTDVLRVELGEQGISVSIVEPGAIKTPAWEKLQTNGAVKVYEDLNDPLLKELYQKDFERMQQSISFASQFAISTEYTTRAIVDALTSKYPKTRYIVGPDAWIICYLKVILPDRVFDKVLRLF